MTTCDVLIVGGGPAGSSCAWALRSSGLDVLVVDRAEFPRNKVCGGWITPHVVAALELDLRAYAADHVLQPITGFRLGCIGRDLVSVHYDSPVSFGIRRSEFDNYLLRRCGARIREGCPIQSIERREDSWVVNGSIHARLLAGAGGHSCPVARLLSDGPAGQPVVAQEVEFEMDTAQEAACNIESQVPELYFCPDLQGYGWCIRKGHFLNVGLGRLDANRGLPAHVADFLEFLSTTRKTGFPLPRRLAGHAYLLAGYSQRRLADEAVLLIGDSAGLAYPQSGEGIRTAVESGILAAETILAANGNYAIEQLQQYPTELAARMINGSGRVESLARHVPPGLRAAAGRLMLSNTLFCRRVVLDNWFLHTRDVPLNCKVEARPQ